jgi:hypothetical protein
LVYSDHSYRVIFNLFLRKKDDCYVSIERGLDAFLFIGGDGGKWKAE